jgi:hypothetical protein
MKVALTPKQLDRIIQALEKSMMQKSEQDLINYLTTIKDRNTNALGCGIDQTKFDDLPF